MKPQMVSSFMAKNIRETTKNFKINHETRSQKKKMRGFPLKPIVEFVADIQISNYLTNIHNNIIPLGGGAKPYW